MLSPCQVSDQPPACIGRLSAPLPTTRILAAALQGQHAAVVLQQHQRLADRLARQIATAAECITARPGAGPSPGRVEQPGPQLHADNARDRVVDPAHRDSPAAHVLDGRRDERLPVVGHHDQVDAGIDRLRAVHLGAARHLLDRIPVADDETVEAEPLLQHVVDKMRGCRASCPSCLPVAVSVKLE